MTEQALEKRNQSLDISSDVLYGIARLALDQVEGLSTVAPPVRVGEFLTGRRAKGLQIDRDGEHVDIELNVTVAYGMRIPEVGGRVQDVVREAVGSMTGLTVRSVRVNVDAIDIPEDTERG